MRTVVINYNQGLVQGQMPHVMPKQAGSTPQLGQVITLLPGLNLVDSKVLETLRKNAAFDQHFKTKIERSLAPEQNPECVGKFILEVDKSVGKDGQVDDEAPLAKLPYEQCKSMIRECFATDMLEKWLKEEGRPDVRRDIANQIEMMKTGNNSGVAA
jgi:hypothetical protein